MRYRDFDRPAFALAAHRTSDWTHWLSTNGIVHDFSPRAAPSCRQCGGPVGGQPVFTFCHNCHNAGPILDALVPLSYSLDDGLESLLHRYKDWSGYQWAAPALGSLLSDFLSRHEPCLVARFGIPGVRTWIPANSMTRSFDHLAKMLTSVHGLSVGWSGGIITRDPNVTRPQRREVKPSAYQVNGPAVARQTVLVLDDLWTSGASLWSAARALKLAGAARVIGIVLGRQLNRDDVWFNNQAIVAEADQRRWTNHGCPFCC